MSATRLAELLAAYALAHPGRPLRQVSALEFAVWCAAAGMTAGKAKEG